MAQVPQYIQIIGLVLGMLGAMVLTIPDSMYKAWYWLTRCSNPPPKQDDKDEQERLESMSLLSRSSHAKINL